MPVNNSRGQAPKTYSQVRQLGALEFLDIVFADLGADDEIILASEYGQRVRFPAGIAEPKFADAHDFLADNTDVKLSLVSLNDYSFGFVASPSVLGFCIDPSIMLLSGVPDEGSFYIWLFEAPVKLDSAEGMELADFVDLETLTIIPGYAPSYRREWELDSGIKYPVADLLDALAKRALADEAARDAANV